jgi:hypothetical protein
MILLQKFPQIGDDNESKFILDDPSRVQCYYGEYVGTGSGVSYARTLSDIGWSIREIGRQQ